VTTILAALAFAPTGANLVPAFEAGVLRDFAATGASLAGQSRRTDFRPEQHGFRFVNTFKNDVIFDIRTGGLCGGMVYAALDFFSARRPIPATIDYRPATGTTLERYIFRRQLKTFENQLDKWAELNFNPGGARNSEFYRWGIQGFDGGRLQELRELIDAGRPAPLGLWHADGHPDRPGDHQVLAVGYEMGRYNGRFGPNAGDLKIFVYDPNWPGHTMVLQPDPESQTFFYSNLSNREAGRWLTYFVDKKHQPETPPAIAETDLGPNDGRIRELILEIGTGGDDLRGGNDNVSVAIGLFGRATHRVANINGGARWIGDYTQFVPIRLPAPVPPESITSITISTNFGGGIGGDNWNMDKLKVRARGGGIDRILLERNASPIKRFTGQVHEHTENLRWLLVRLATGSAGLSGGSLNANAIVSYRGRAPDSFNNLNKGQPWRPNTTVRDALLLKQTVPVTLFSLICTYGRNRLPAWNLNTLSLTVRENGRDNVIYNQTGNPLFAFSPDRTSFQVRIP